MAAGLACELWARARVRSLRPKVSRRAELAKDIVCGGGCRRGGRGGPERLWHLRSAAYACARH
eukprot:3688999-Alexandrium_andersonii.AAC.1